MLYFAYGSNLFPPRLARRAPSARVVQTGRVLGRTLAFHKIGRDGSGKCDIPGVASGTAIVYGALIQIDEADWLELDRVEGAGKGYVRTGLTVDTDAGPVDADTYLALPKVIDPSLRPFHWYKQLVLEGARVHGFPELYLDAIRAVQAIQDDDADRARDELEVLRSPNS